MVRDDARAARAARRARASTGPARVTQPVAATGVIAGLTAVAVIVAGGSLAVVVGAVVAIAVVAAFVAHKTTASLAAGVALLTVRPYQPGERIRLYSDERGTVVDAEIVHLGLINTTLCTDAGVLVVANTRMISQAPGQTAH